MSEQADDLILVKRSVLEEFCTYLSVNFHDGQRYEYGGCELCGADWSEGTTEHPKPWHKEDCLLYKEHDHA